MRNPEKEPTLSERVSRAAGKNRDLVIFVLGMATASVLILLAVVFR